MQLNLVSAVKRIHIVPAMIRLSIGVQGICMNSFPKNHKKNDLNLLKLTSMGDDHGGMASAEGEEDLPNCS